MVIIVIIPCIYTVTVSEYSTNTGVLTVNSILLKKAGGGYYYPCLAIRPIIPVFTVIADVYCRGGGGQLGGWENSALW